MSTIERIVCIFSMSFQGWSLVVNIDAVVYAVVSLVVLSVQLLFESRKSPSSNPLLTQSLILSASTMCVLSVMSNFYGPDIQTVGRFLTMAGLVQESMLFGVDIGKSNSAQEFFGLLPAAAAVSDSVTSTKRKKSTQQKKRKVQ